MLINNKIIGIKINSSCCSDIINVGSYKEGNRLMKDLYEKFAYDYDEFGSIDEYLGDEKTFFSRIFSDNCVKSVLDCAWWNRPTSADAGTVRIQCSGLGLFKINA